ncbi:MAG TPA: ABC-F family ATP-binding cassette domain-containing protein [Solirubrobacteraceae bacterium]|nr:ABC-F family ATP-binding cassette domain-containing protein [Solirubrobacteraceae bacterium]
MPAPRNLVSLQDVAKSYGSRAVLQKITLGVASGERIGVVGRNGDGKSTLLRLVAGAEMPDAGTLVRSGALEIALLGQRDELDPSQTIRETLIGARADHEWAGDAAFRGVLDGLMGGVEMRLFSAGLDTPIEGLSGGERKRIALAHLLLDAPELLLLDEPTNHLDIESVDWLARHLAARRGSLMVVTHDRWFLDAVCTETWEVADSAVHRYEGGYAAYVLARAERERVEASRASRRRQLLRKELAWLRRGPPARTSKPKFRIEAANALIADEPEPRDRAELLRFATSRLGSKVLDVLDVSLTLGSRTILNEVTWRLGPSDRIAIVGVNGSGKTSLIKLLAGELQPTSGTIERGSTVRVAHLSQRTPEVAGDLRVLDSLREVRSHATLSDGQEITAEMLCERFGFRGEKAYAPVERLSGGERRRLALMRLLMAGPNVLLLDEPTNDLDVDTLTALEDLLDGWPGTLVVVSHDRYFVERACDEVYAITGEGGVRHLPGGIEQYVEQRREANEQPKSQSECTEAVAPGTRIRAERKQAQRSKRELQRMESTIEQLTSREGELGEQMAAVASDHVELARLQAELERTIAEREQLETAWLQTSESLEG